MKKILSILPLLLFLLILSCEKKSNILDIVYTVRNNGNFKADKKTGLGGIPARKVLFKKISQGSQTLFLDTGNFLPDIINSSRKDIPFLKLMGEAIIEGYARLGYTAVNISTGDLMFGVDFILKRAEKSGLTDISLNIKDSEDKNIFKPYIIKRFYKEKRVLITGITEGGFNLHPGVVIESIEKAVKRFLKIIKKESPDAVVIMGMLNKRQKGHLLNILKNLSANFFYIDGKTPGFAYLPEKIGENLFYVSAPGKGFYAGSIFYNLNTGQVEKGKIYDISEKNGWDKGMKSFITKTLKRIKYYKTKRSNELPSGFAGVTSCKNCHPDRFKKWKEHKHSRSWETLLKAGRDTDWDCLPCHIAVPLQPRSLPDKKIINKIRGVQCETCHGEAKNHIKARGKIPLKKVGISTCKECHNARHSPFSEGYMKRIVCGQ